jgi:cell division protein ZapB
MSEQEHETLELAALEARVDELIHTVDNLASENRALKNQHVALTAERALLIEKTEMARTRVEAMIARLKAMESRS